MLKKESIRMVKIGDVEVGEFPYYNFPMEDVSDPLSGAL